MLRRLSTVVRCELKLQAGQHIFLVGIGGSGLSAIARVLLGQGYKVSGSDRSLNSLTDALERDGATIYKGHDAAQIKGADALIITSAVKDDHVEVAAAKDAGIPVYKRQDIMADLMEGKTVIAVAGTKGKTTTTSMIVHILRECGQDPSYIVGGIMGNTGTNAGVGKGDAFVVEADEYDNMFLGLKPDIAVITNIEWDHPDFFKTPEDMVESFRRFVGLLDDYRGLLITCADNELAWDLAQELMKDGKLASGYGVDDIGSLRAKNITVDTEGFTKFQVWTRESDLPLSKPFFARINLPGLHNIQNALAAIMVVAHAIPAPKWAKALETFKPTARRFDLRADVKGIAIVDDYAHNPMSIKAVIEAAKQRYPERAVWAVWQPHTYSRTQALFNQFVTAFDEADHVLVTDIYAAREAPIEGVTSAAVVAAMRHKDARHTATFADTVKVLRNEVQAPAVIIIMSAGDAPEIGVAYLKALQEDV
ncbi:MAG: UDP-N-acetylmuramate--L-alanine ligase [Anaerolineaceae bacterium]|nr:UDP-N-acetylmuramate--L-alanine ligase [Anaerolineaceae bacterium]